MEYRDDDVDRKFFALSSSGRPSWNLCWSRMLDNELVLESAGIMTGNVEGLENDSAECSCSIRDDGLDKNILLASYFLSCCGFSVFNSVRIEEIGGNETDPSF
jgi:hypothetical protein